MKTDEGAAGVEVAPPPKVNGLAPVLAAAAAGLEAAGPKSKGDAAAVVTTGAAAAPKANGEGATAWPGAAAGVFPKPNTLPVEAAFVTDGKAVVALPAVPPKEKEAVVVWAGATLDPKAGAGWPKTPAAGAFEVTELAPKLKLAFEASAGFAPKAGAWVVVAGAAPAPNWKREGAADGAGVELTGVAPKENVGAEVAEGAPKAGGAVPVAPKAGAVVATAPKEGGAAVPVAAPKVGATVVPATPKG